MCIAPPIILFEEGLMRHPNLLLASPERQCAGMIFCIPPPEESYYLLADFILEWAEQHGISQIITITSFESNTPSSDILVVAEKENYTKMLEYGGIPLKTGKVDGFQAAILEASLLSPIDASILAVETKKSKPDLTKVQQLVDMFLNVAEINIASKEEENFLKKYEEALKIIFGSKNSSIES